MLGDGSAIRDCPSFKIGVHNVPTSIEDWVAKLKLAAMNITIDKLTREQVKYLASSGEGT